MKGSTILVLTDDQRLWRRVAGPLSSAATHVLWARTPEQAEVLADTHSLDLVVVDPVTGPDAARVARRAPVMAVGCGATAPLVSAWLTSGAPSLVARLGAGEVAPDFNPLELALAAGKLLRGDLFGLEKHLASFGVAIESRVLTGAGDREPLLAALAEQASRLRLGARRSRLVLDVADELATNAIYDAPRDAAGTPRYAHVDRRGKLELEPTEYVTVRHGSDGRLFGLSITDSFGGLFAERLASCLVRAAGASDQLEHKAGGAGIGLYLALRSADELVIAVEPGRRTEVTALWRLDRRSPATTATICYLVASPPAAPDGIVAVELSDSMRVEVSAVPRTVPALASGPAPMPPLDERDEPELTLVERADGFWSSDDGMSAIDADTFEIVEATEPGLATPDVGDPLAELRGVHLLRTTHQPGIDTTIARLRGLTRVSSILAAATGHLLSDWTAACVLEVDDDEIRALCAAGDAAYPNALGLFATGRGDANALAYLARQGGLMLGPVSHPTCEAALAELLLGPGAADALALALAVAGRVRYLLFAARPRGLGFEERGDHQRLLRELTHALERTARLAPPIPTAAPAGPGDAFMH